MPCDYIFLIDINITFLPLDRLYLYSSAEDPEDGPGTRPPPKFLDQTKKTSKGLDDRSPLS